MIATTSEASTPIMVRGGGAVGIGGNLQDTGVRVVRGSCPDGPDPRHSGDRSRVPSRRDNRVDASQIGVERRLTVTFVEPDKRGAALL